jgi:urea transporter
LFILLNFALVDMFYGDEAFGLQSFLAIFFAGVTLFATFLFGGLTGYIVAKIATFVIIGRCLLSARRR